MTEKELQQLKYPIGEFKQPKIINKEIISTWIEDINTLPFKLQSIINELSESQLNSPYRPNGWTGKQVIHHLADSHMNSWIRFKLSLTEDTPTIKPYLENKWAEQVDYSKTPVELSLQLLTALHARWAILLKSLKDSDLQRKFYHPESKKEYSLATNIGIYAWHGEHHLGHLNLLKR